MVFILLVFSVCGEVLKICVDKSVDITVHNRVDVTVLKAGSGILGKSVGHKYVGTDLATPLDIRLVTLNILDSVKLLAELDLHQLCLQHFKGSFLVLQLATFGLTTNNDTGRLMHDTDSRVGLVDVLTTCTG